MNYMKNVLVLVPHCDDEVLGCGGAMQYHITRGDVVSVCFVKKVYDNRSKIQQKDSQKVKHLLNYKYNYYLNIKPEDFTVINARTIERVENFINEKKYDVIYTTHPGDAHQDHRSLFEIVKTVTRTYSKRFVKQILCCETLSSTGLSINLETTFTPNYYIKLTQEQIELKVKALELYKNELRKFPHPRSAEGIITMSRLRGSEIGCSFAEAFFNLRTVID